MATFYLSSTVEDLKDCRQRVCSALMKGGHVVVGMENDSATGIKPLKKCLEDVARCDAYVGIFAWRYGYIPDDDNPQRRSITELEYLKAVALPINTLIFILDESAPWSRKLMDANGKQIERLRSHLTKEHTVAFFRDPGELAEAVLTAVAGFPRSDKSAVAKAETTGVEHPIIPPAPVPFWKRHIRLILGVIIAVLVVSLSAYLIRRSSQPVAQPAPPERVNSWEARFTKKLDDQWQYPKDAWDTEPGEVTVGDKDALALLVKGRGMGIPRDLGDQVFYDFRAVFKIRFKQGIGAAWVLRAQPDRQSGYLFEINKRGATLYLSGWVYDGNQRGKNLADEALPFKCCEITQGLLIQAIVRNNRIEYTITFEDDREDLSQAGDDVTPKFLIGESDFHWRWGTFGFLGTEDGSVMKVESLSINPLPRSP